MSVHALNNPNARKIHATIPDALEDMLRKMGFPDSVQDELTEYAHQLDIECPLPEFGAISIPATVSEGHDRLIEEAMRTGLSAYANECNVARTNLIYKLVACRWREIQARGG